MGHACPKRDYRSLYSSSCRYSIQRRHNIWYNAGNTAFAVNQQGNNSKLPSTIIHQIRLIVLNFAHGRLISDGSIIIPSPHRNGTIYPQISIAFNIKDLALALFSRRSWFYHYPKD